MYSVISHKKRHGFDFYFCLLTYFISREAENYSLSLGSSSANIIRKVNLKWRKNMTTTATTDVGVSCALCADRWLNSVPLSKSLSDSPGSSAHSPGPAQAWTLPPASWRVSWCPVSPQEASSVLHPSGFLQPEGVRCGPPSFVTEACLPVFLVLWRHTHAWLH